MANYACKNQTTVSDTTSAMINSLRILFLTLSFLATLLNGISIVVIRKLDSGNSNVRQIYKLQIFYLSGIDLLFTLSYFFRQLLQLLVYSSLSQAAIFSSIGKFLLHCGMWFNCFRNWVIAHIAIQRMFLISMPIRSSRGQGFFQLRVTHVINGIMMAISCGITIPSSVDTQIIMCNNESQNAYRFQTKQTNFNSIPLLVHFVMRDLIPILLVISASIRTVIQLKTRVQDLNVNCQARSSFHFKTFHSLFVVCVTFVVLESPMFVTHIVCSFEGNLCLIVLQITVFIKLIDSLMNFFIYILIDNRLRTMLRTWTRTAVTQLSSCIPFQSNDTVMNIQMRNFEPETQRDRDRNEGLDANG